MGGHGGRLLLLLLLALPNLAATPAGDGDCAGLTLAVRVNTVTVTGPPGSAVRGGTAVVKEYRLTNAGETGLRGIRVTDAARPVPCPEAEPLAVGATVVCTLRLTAEAGVHDTTATARGRSGHSDREVAATAPSGYTGVVSALGLAVDAAPGAPGSGTAALRYTVADLGDRPLYDLRLRDVLVPDGIDCGDGPAAPVALGPGRTVRCAAVLRRPPGTYRSAAEVTGSDGITTVGPRGEPVPPPLLVARAGTDVTLAARPPEYPPENPSENPPGTAPGPAVPPGTTPG
ncbi:hypothetical protein ACFWA9_36645, partial [Kitasatospora sp. NPDC059973]